MKKKYKILIVDDDIDNIRTIRNCISASGETYILYQALEGEVAIRIAMTEMPDLIITDWEMPGMDGIELIRRIKQLEPVAGIPVIMCTGVMTSSENLQTALTAGAVDYVRKPVDAIELSARIRSMLMLSDSNKELHLEYLIVERNNRLINALMESIPHPFVYYSIEGEIRKCNCSFKKLLGLPDQTDHGVKIFDYLDDENARIHLEQDKKLTNERTELHYEINFAGRKFISYKTFLHNPDIDLEGIICVMTDVTELERAHLEILESKKLELTSSALRLIRISELNNRLVSDLETISSFTNEKGSEMIRHAINMFKVHSGEKFWKEFESRFENVYESFYARLSQMFSDLTPGEKKMCALLRLNLSSKDIASITFQNPQSVDMTRYRLRKKMHLKKEENLVDYLMNIN